MRVREETIAFEMYARARFRGVVIRVPYVRIWGFGMMYAVFFCRIVRVYMERLVGTSHDHNQTRLTFGSVLVGH